MYEFIIIGAIFVAYLFSYGMNAALSKIPLQNIRLIFPLCIVLVLSLLSELFSWVFNDAISLIIFIMFLPTAGIFTMIPFIEPYLKNRRISSIITAGSILFTVIFFLFQFSGLEPGGAPSILIPFNETMPVFSIFLIYYFEFCIITAVFLGGLIISRKILKIDQINKYHLLATIALLVFSYFLLQSLIVGILAVFVYTMIRGHTRNLALPLVLLLVSIISAIIFVYPLSDRWVGGISEYYSYSVLTLGVAAPSMVAVIPLFERFSRMKREWEIPVFLVSSIGVSVLALPGSGYDIPAVITRAVSIITSGIQQASKISFDSGFVYCIFLIVGSVIITTVLYGICALFMTYRRVQEVQD
ncbi:hypothetical protein J2741_000302 [Methanolinea mesophila]|uniref:hypothetical protein n=1 Tax=Methanolinea mesophila TaxID=547055 RepID=UPI001AEA66EF|nr:hypothetical protein [Methanolinea mesophila]MBP1927755.1 hypothetical protein [Methanolinea mesophila]